MKPTPTVKKAAAPAQPLVTVPSTRDKVVGLRRILPDKMALVSTSTTGWVEAELEEITNPSLSYSGRRRIANSINQKLREGRAKWYKLIGKIDEILAN